MLYIEGETIVKELLYNFPNLIEALIIQEDQIEDFQDTKTAIYTASAQDLQKLTQLKTPKTLNAIVHYPTASAWKEGQKALLLDQIQDPGNLGTIIRTADWFGIEHIFCAPGTADYLNPKVIHAL